MKSEEVLTLGFVLHLIPKKHSILSLGTRPESDPVAYQQMKTCISSLQGHFSIMTKISVVDL